MLKKIIRTIHHLPASGGTLFSKCVAVMPSVVLISEVSPKGGVNYGGFCSYLAFAQTLKRYGDLIPDEAKEIHFLQGVDLIASECVTKGKRLVLRDHAHADFIANDRGRSSLVSALDAYGGFTRISICTVRHPLDCYISSQGKFLPKNWTLEMYSLRALKFYRHVGDLQSFKYEAFCCNPLSVMRDICSALHLEFDEKFLLNFGKVTLTGDSGRKSLTSIQPRERQVIDDDVLVMQTRTSEAYKKLCGLLDYDSNFDSSPFSY